MIRLIIVDRKCAANPPPYALLYIHVYYDDRVRRVAAYYVATTIADAYRQRIGTCRTRSTVAQSALECERAWTRRAMLRTVF